MAVAARHAVAQRLQPVVHHTVHRAHGRTPGDRKINHTGQGVQISPRTLAHGGRVAVLLDRRKTGLEHHRQGLGHIADDAPRRAEIQQQRAAVRQQNVVGGDISVITIDPVNFLQRIEHGQQPGAQQDLIRRAAEGCQRLFERGALVIGHGHVGRTVGLPEAVHLQQRGMVELG